MKKTFPCGHLQRTSSKQCRHCKPTIPVTLRFRTRTVLSVAKFLAYKKNKTLQQFVVGLVEKAIKRSKGRR